MISQRPLAKLKPWLMALQGVTIAALKEQL